MILVKGMVSDSLTSLGIIGKTSDTILENGGFKIYLINVYTVNCVQCVLEEKINICFTMTFPPILNSYSPNERLDFCDFFFNNRANGLTMQIYFHSFL